MILVVALNIGVVLLANEKHSYTLDEIGQRINSPIPADATDIVYNSETRYGHFIKLSFKAPPDSAVAFAKHICGENLYQGYDPFNATDSSASKTDYAIIKWAGYAYFSHSNTSETIFGNRCQLKTRPFNPIQISVDQTDPRQYQVRFELLETACSVGLTCSGYGIETSAKRPLLSQDSPIPFIVYGFEDKRDAYILDGRELCTETDPGLYRDWGKPPFNLDDMKGASFELFVDDTSKGQAIISDNGRLKVDYSTGQFIGLYEPPEYCFQVDSSAGTHQMSITVKTVSGKEYQYAWGFRVQS